MVIDEIRESIMRQSACFHSLHFTGFTAFLELLILHLEDIIAVQLNAPNFLQIHKISVFVLELYCALLECLIWWACCFLFCIIVVAAKNISTRDGETLVFPFLFLCFFFVVLIVNTAENRFKQQNLNQLVSLMSLKFAKTPIASGLARYAS